MQNSKRIPPRDKLEAVKAIYGGARYKTVAKRFGVRRETVDEWCRTLEARSTIVFAHGASHNVAEKLRRQLAVAQKQIADLKAKLDDKVQDDDDDLPAP